MRAFISYSHKDDWALERLHTHLAILVRDGKLSAWFDREILAGGSVDAEISKKLAESELFLPLLSPDFLNSDYCYETEMETALARHEAEEIRIVPIIVEPCDWMSTPLQAFKALPKDGKPISEWGNPNVAYLDVVTELRKVIDLGVSDGGSSSTKKEEAENVTSNQKYRVKRTFDEIDKADFRVSAFDTIRSYFKASVSEIDSIDGIKARYAEVSGEGFTCTVVNSGLDKGVAEITVFAGSSGRFFGDIYYSFEANAQPNKSNGGFQVSCDDYELFLQDSGLMFDSSEERLSPHAAAEALWEDFVSRAGIENA